MRTLDQTRQAFERNEDKLTAEQRRAVCHALNNRLASITPRQPLFFATVEDASVVARVLGDGYECLSLTQADGEHVRQALAWAYEHSDGSAFPRAAYLDALQVLFS